jgi:protocatechuate 3,4-dioxygenase beta subunit
MRYINRRTLLQSLALAPVMTSALPATLRAQAAQVGLIGTNVCMLSTEVTEGPFYIDPGLVRSDITEGRPGLPLALRMQVVDADCTPVPDARVDIWHCDADGIYSGVVGQGPDETLDTQGETFMRGTQMTDTNGVVQFATIYPGWYAGRTTHIHYKIYLPTADNAGETRNILTSQIFFDDTISDTVFAGMAPYAARTTVRDTRNAADSIAIEAGHGAYCTLTGKEQAYAADFVVGINPEAKSTKSWFEWAFFGLRY